MNMKVEDVRCKSSPWKEVVNNDLTKSVTSALIQGRCNSLQYC